MHLDQLNEWAGTPEQSTGFGPGEERTIMKAWEDYLAGTSRQLKVRNVVAQSWERCAAIGIDHKLPGSKTIIEQREFEQRLQRNRLLLQAAAKVLSEAQQLLIGSGSMLLLTDVDGVVLDAVGDPGTLEAGQDINLVVGADWSEANAGTNGIGTTLASRAPVLIHGPEHFCALTKNWTCVGAPVRNPLDGVLLGLVDMSGAKSTFQQHNLAFAVMVARGIEAALSLQLEVERRMLLEYSSGIGRGWSDGVIVVDRGGQVVLANEHAPRLMAMRAKAREFADGSFHSDQPLLTLNKDGRSFDLAAAARYGINPGNLLPVHHDGALIGAVVIAAAAQRPPAPAVIRSKAFEPIVTNCAIMLDAIHRASRLAIYQAPVLIEGETGVGKELFARAIHDASPCADGPFIPFNCGAISRDLIATELFGYVKGAFTGAASNGNIGRFERANNGTLCLDEIGELPLDLQPFLLRVLEEGAVCRVGDATPRPIKVRLIAMTNRDLREEVEKGRFRRDLLYRLNVSTLKVPPLRKRDGDAVLLAQHFLNHLSKKHDLGLRCFAPDVLRLFKTYPWPGNIRELRNVVESALLLCDTPVIGRGWLPEEIVDYRLPEERSDLSASCRLPRVRADSCSLDEELPRASDLRSLGKQHIENVLHRFQGNISLTAAALGIARTTLYRRLKAYGLDMPRDSNSAPDADRVAE
ncbi:GAF modulated sigma54 specific transcriptional regulator, Fis family [Methylocella tundrae]|uniref:GAF modulated sigma54 specific transcriptional regulator, Fis family n=1 Tax=Methylocella tundrae TaxID=227605 RepID=A0A8B6MCV1_METTU|nr:sigma-54-dependent Fis family transcriptional regulator [Methylocella tundrae]VTZ25493.1 GAF modulated sigma54 specific transcriptional regulator, Fis family [Methylocella tundrae]VTZ52068.1 GAF modulated sigma54 specific transcriptional regulator, Fis family [Methylocella tundrae]